MMWDATQKSGDHLIIERIQELNLGPHSFQEQLGRTEATIDSIIYNSSPNIRHSSLKSGQSELATDQNWDRADYQEYS